MSCPGDQTAVYGSRSSGPDAPHAMDVLAGHAGPHGSILGGTRSLLEAVLRELNDGLHSHRARGVPVARARSERQQV